MENQNTQDLAERIAHLLRKNEKGSEAFWRSSFETINQRLDRIESQSSFPNSKFQTPNSQSLHSSREKFINLEELADEITDGSQTEKACPFEPTGKPCDHCAMCNSRGF